MNEGAIDRKLVCAFIAGLISDDGEREKGLEYIRNMPPVNPTKTGWIPVSERLPEDSSEYLISVIDGSGEDNGYEAVGVSWFAHKKDYGIKESGWKGLSIDETVIAWMPLPTPYESQERSDKK